MTDLRKAAEMALEALEEVNKLSVGEKAICLPAEIDDSMEALRQALAQPEQKQKTPLKVLNLTVFTENRLRNGRVYDVETLQAMTNRDILAIPDMGKKALAEVLEALNVHAVNISQERVDETAKCGRDWVEMQCPCGHKMYVKHTGREWVGLTPTDMEELSATWWKPNGDEMALIDWVETKLKEKNT